MRTLTSSGSAAIHSVICRCVTAEPPTPTDVLAVVEFEAGAFRIDAAPGVLK